MTATKKRTARSASTRSTRQGPTDITADELKRIRSEVMDLDRSNQMLATQRNAAEERSASLERSLAACEGAIRAANAKAASAAKMAVEMRIVIARKDGYIDRVREQDDQAIATPVRNPAPGEFIDDVREALSQVDETTFDRMVESMSKETLERVMGKTNEKSDILR